MDRHLHYVNIVNIPLQEPGRAGRQAGRHFWRWGITNDRFVRADFKKPSRVQKQAGELYVGGDSISFFFSFEKTLIMNRRAFAEASWSG